MLGDFASLDVQNTYRGSDAYEVLADPQSIEAIENNKIELLQLSYLELNSVEYIQKVLANITLLDQDACALNKLRVVYSKITQQIESGQLKVHGLGGGSAITFKGERTKVPEGISKIWYEITDMQGNFRWMDNVSAVLNKVKVEANNRSGYRGLTAIGLFFGSYRDAQTKDLYSKISQAL